MNVIFPKYQILMFIYVQHNWSDCKYIHHLLIREKIQELWICSLPRSFYSFIPRCLKMTNNICLFWITNVIFPTPKYCHFSLTTASFLTELTYNINHFFLNTKLWTKTWPAYTTIDVSLPQEGYLFLSMLSVRRISQKVDMIHTHLHQTRFSTILYLRL